MKMQIEVLKSKIHRASVTQANLNYVGSITIDEDLLDAAGMIEGEKVQVLDIDNGERLETYIIKGERGSGAVCLNGAAARKVQVGDKVRIIPVHICPVCNLYDRAYLISGDEVVQELEISCRGRLQ